MATGWSHLTQRKVTVAKYELFSQKLPQDYHNQHLCVIWNFAIARRMFRNSLFPESVDKKMQMTVWGAQNLTTWAEWRTIKKALMSHLSACLAFNLQWSHWTYVVVNHFMIALPLGAFHILTSMSEILIKNLSAFMNGRKRSNPSCDTATKTSMNLQDKDFLFDDSLRSVQDSGSKRGLKLLYNQRNPILLLDTLSFFPTCG